MVTLKLMGFHYIYRTISDFMSVCPYVRTYVHTNVHKSQFHFFQFLESYHKISLIKIAWQMLGASTWTLIFLGSLFLPRLLHTRLCTTRWQRKRGALTRFGFTVGRLDSSIILSSRNRNLLFWK